MEMKLFKPVILWSVRWENGMTDLNCLVVLYFYFSIKTINWILLFVTEIEATKDGSIRYRERSLFSRSKLDATKIAEDERMGERKNERATRFTI